MSNDLLLAQNVLPKAGASPGAGTVQDSAPSPGGPGPGSPLAGMLPILLMAVVFIPIILMSSRRQKKESQARAALKKGDRVVTNSGLIGDLVEMDDRIAKVKISPSVTVQMVANTVSPFTEPEKTAPKELKEAKAVPEKK